MNRLLKPAGKLLAVTLLIAAAQFGTEAMAMDPGDKCAAKYDANDPIIARYEQAAKVKPLVPSRWETAKTKGLNFNFETASATNQDVIVRVTAIPPAQKQDLIDQLAVTVKSTTIASATIEALLIHGFPFAAKLCTRPNNSLYIDLTGIGGATGRSGKIEIKPEPDSIYVSGVIAGGQIDGSVQIQK